jgi:hypothetical protein
MGTGAHFLFYLYAFYFFNNILTCFVAFHDIGHLSQQNLVWLPDDCILKCWNMYENIEY